MDSLQNRVNAAITAAMKARDAAALTPLRALKTALMNAAIEKGGAGSTLDEPEAQAVIRRQIKQREDAAANFRDGGRPELAANEESEIVLLRTFLPAPLDEAALAALIDQAIAETGATSKADLGKVMKAATALADGRADGRTLSQAIAARLGS